MSVTSYLLDTHVLLWWLVGSRKVSKKALSAIRDERAAILVSCASLWEIAIKTRKGTLQGCEDYLAGYQRWHDRWGFSTLDIGPDHAVLAGALPVALADPFDRMLIAQSQLSGALLVTADRAIQAVHGAWWW